MKTIGVFFGSRSPEHDVSIITAELIISGLKKLGYPVVPVYLTKRGEWLIGSELGTLSFFSEGHRDWSRSDLRRYYFDFEQSLGKIVFRKKGFVRKEVVIDIAFPAFHGSYGEDGTVQGLFEMLDIPYVGCDVTSSAIAMDKALTKMTYQAHGIPTTKFVYFTKREWDREMNVVLGLIGKALTTPLFVKPARLGSSIGVAKVRTSKELSLAIEVALHYDTKALVEEAVEPVKDITCAVIGNEEPVASLLQESVFTNDFFSYEDKYLKEGGAQLGKAEKSLVIPANLDGKTTEAIRNMAIRIYKLFGCSGTSRVDFLYDTKRKKFFANEINTLPGTLYHHLWKASGIEFGDFLKKLIVLAEERHAQKKSITYTFESDILKYARSAKLRTEGGGN